MKTISLAELEKMATAGGVDTVLTVFPDQQGRLAGKRYTARTFLSQAREGWEGCDYLLGCDVENEPLPGYSSFSWERGYGDFMVRPDLGTLVLIPWLDRTAMVLGDVEGRDHQPLPVAPRQILQAQVRRAEKMGLTIRIASELEFYVFKDSYEQAGARRYQDLDTSGKYIQDYHILQTTKEEKLMQPLRRYFDALGFEVENSKGEWGPGQEELNLGHEEPVEMADRHSIFKHGVKEVAALMGMSVTFMAKWNTSLAGSSCHLHSSLWDKKTGDPLGWDPKGPAHMSARLGAWVSGQLELGRELSVFYAPYVNSYRRYQAGTFAPTRLVAGVDNRTCGIRILGHSAKAIRVENRCPGADANSYLAFAATIAAGLYGIEQGLKFEGLYTGNAYADPAVREVPKTLYEAVALLAGSKAARAAFGDVVVDHYVNTARQEQAVYDRRVSDVDLQRNFERA
ncbi:MAG TPA: glutamine synthetase family protein [Gemmatimonadales bacterium]|nr:glutamine synthetase family protein [Gemmatimonadales bacterium]